MKLDLETHTPKSDKSGLSFGENAILTIKVLTGAAVLLATIWGLDLAAQ